MFTYVYRIHARKLFHSFSIFYCIRLQKITPSTIPRLTDTWTDSQYNNTETSNAMKGKDTPGYVPTIFLDSKWENQTSKRSKTLLSNLYTWPWNITNLSTISLRIANNFVYQHDQCTRSQGKERQPEHASTPMTDASLQRSAPRTAWTE